MRELICAWTSFLADRQTATRKDGSPLWALLWCVKWNLTFIPQMKTSTLHDSAAHVTLFMMNMRLQTLPHLIHNIITVELNCFNVTILCSFYSDMTFFSIYTLQDIDYYWLWTALDYQSVCGSHSRDFANSCLSLARSIPRRLRAKQCWDKVLSGARLIKLSTTVNQITNRVIMNTLALPHQLQ